MVSEQVKASGGENADLEQLERDLTELISLTEGELAERSDRGVAGVCWL